MTCNNYFVTSLRPNNKKKKIARTSIQIVNWCNPNTSELKIQNNPS